MAVDEVNGVAQLSQALRTEEKNLKPPEFEKPAQDSSPPKDAAVSPTAGAKGKEEAAKEKQRVEAAAHQLNEFMKRSSIQLKFSVDADTKEVVVKVVQKQTGKVIRQIPSDEALKLEKSFDSLQGVIIKKTV